MRVLVREVTNENGTGSSDDLDEGPWVKSVPVNLSPRRDLNL